MPALDGEATNPPPGGGLDDASIPYFGERGESLADAVRRLDLLMNGDPRRDVVGLRKRVAMLEDWRTAQQRQELLLKGLVAGLGINVLFTVIALLKLFGYLPAA